MKYRKFILIALIATVVVSIGAFRFIATEHLVYSSAYSEDGYVVKMFQKRGIIPSQREVYLRASANDRVIIDNGLVFSGDTFDDDFNERQPQKFWLNHDIFAFGNFQGSAVDTLEIENNGENVLDYIFIQTQNSGFIIFDLEPRTQRYLQIDYDGILAVQAKNSKGDKFGKAVTRENGVRAENSAFSVRILNKDLSLDSANFVVRETDCCFYRW